VGRKVTILEAIGRCQREASQLRTGGGIRAAMTDVNSDQPDQKGGLGKGDQFQKHDYKEQLRA